MVFALHVNREQQKTTTEREREKINVTPALIDSFEQKFEYKSD